MLTKQRSLFLLTIIVAIYAIFKAYLNTDLETLFDGDSLAIARFMQVMTSNVTHIWDWTFAPSSYFFPDTFFYAIFYFMFHGDIMLAYMVYIFCLPLYFLLITCLIGKVFNERAQLFSALVLAVVFFLYAQGQLGGTASYESGFWDPIFEVTYHFGGMAVAATSLFLILRQLKYGVTRCQSVSNIILLALVSLSDPLLLCVYVGPCFLAGLFCFLTEKTAQSKLNYKKITMQLFWGALIGTAIYHLLPLHQTKSWHASLLFSNLPHWHERLMGLVSYFSLLFRGQPGYAALLFFVYSVIICDGVRIVFNRLKHHEINFSPMATILCLYLIVLIPCLALVALGIDNYITIVGYHSLKYYNVLLVFPIAFYLPYLLSRAVKAVSLSVVLVFLVIFGYALYLTPEKHDLSAIYNFYPSYVECADKAIEKYHLKLGVSSYREARLITLLGKNKTPMVIVNPDFTVRHWENDLTIDERHDFDFVFVLGDQVKTSVLYTKAGKPDAVYQCQAKDQSVLVYQHGQLSDIFKGEYIVLPFHELLMKKLHKLFH
ncbi:MAG: hypothetical protein ACE365_02585 [Gammaproteobacteria bacterium]